MKTIKKFLNIKVEILMGGIVLMLCLFTFNQAAKLQIKVKAEMSYIHLWPDDKSQIIGRAHLGTILNVEYKRGKWYRVDLPPDERGIIVSGYIHQRFVEDKKEEEKKEVSKTILKTREEPGYEGELVSLKFRDADVRDVILFLCSFGGLNVVFDPGVSGKVTCDLRDVPWDQALDVILKSNKLSKVIEGNVLRTGKADILIRNREDNIEER